MSSSIETTLNSIAETIFTDDLLETLLVEDRRNMLARDSIIHEGRYYEGKNHFKLVFNESQKADLAALEGLRRSSLQALSQFSVLSGLYTGFQQALTDTPSQDLFYHSAAHDALDKPQVCPAYFDKWLQAEAAFQRIREPLSEEERAALVNVDTAWEDRAYGVAVQGFRLGFHAAVRILETLCPKELSSLRLAALHGAEDDLAQF